MHSENLHRWQHDHNFHGGVEHGERNTRRVMALTMTMMVIEIVAGILSGSMALLADGWLWEEESARAPPVPEMAVG